MTLIIGALIMKNYKIFSILFLTFFSGTSLSNQMELGIHEDLIDLRFTVDLAQDFGTELGFLHTDNDTVDSEQISYSFFTQDKENDLNFHLSGKVYLLNVNDDSGFGVAIGVGVNRNFSDKIQGSLQASYAPDIITGGDFKNFYEMDLRIDYQIVENGSIFIGSRNQEVNNGLDDIQVFDGNYIGIKFNF
tara:strand:+ start:279 stop:848 length:570 start_codon:yes stop_codon:yes gene_type:complete